MNMANEMSEASMGSTSTARGELKDNLSRKEREIGILNNKLIEMEKDLNMSKQKCINKDEEIIQLTDNLKHLNYEKELMSARNHGRGNNSSLLKIEELGQMEADLKFKDQEIVEM